MKINFKRAWTFIPLLLAGIVYYIIGSHIGFFIKCPLHKYFGLDCPGCGATRMAVAMIHGNYYQAFRFNPLIFFLLPEMFIMVSYALGIIEFEGKYQKIYLKCVEIIGVMAVVFFVLRNIPFFYFLKPTVV